MAMPENSEFHHHASLDLSCEEIASAETVILRYLRKAAMSGEEVMRDTLARRKQAKAKTFSDSIWETAAKDLEAGGHSGVDGAAEACRKAARECYSDWQKLRNFPADTPAVFSKADYEPIVAFMCSEWADRTCRDVSKAASVRLSAEIPVESLTRTRDSARSLFLERTIAVAASAREAAMKAAKDTWVSKQAQMAADIAKTLATTPVGEPENRNVLGTAIERWAAFVDLPPTCAEFEKKGKETFAMTKELLAGVSTEIAAAHYHTP